MLLYLLLIVQVLPALFPLVSSKSSLLLPVLPSSYESPSKFLIKIEKPFLFSSISIASATPDISSPSEEISKYDISTYYERSLNLSDEERHDLIRNISIVKPGFIFPISSPKK